MNRPCYMAQYTITCIIKFLHYSNSAVTKENVYFNQILIIPVYTYLYPAKYHQSYNLLDGQMVVLQNMAF